MKQAIVIRSDLKMGKGKMCSQACHACISSFLKSDERTKERWLNEGMKKIVLKVQSEKELRMLFREAKKEKLPCELIVDAGLTQVEEGTATALGIGPDAEAKIDKLTSRLKLL
jgi:peptidyl-tRNA hydrolase, PTH2 family